MEPWPRHPRSGSKSTAPTRRSPSTICRPVINPTTSRTPQKAQSNSNLIVIAGVVASLFLFWYLHLLTLNQLTQLSGGQAMPDSLVGRLRPGVRGAIARGHGRRCPGPAELRPQDGRDALPADLWLHLAAADRNQRGTEIPALGAVAVPLLFAAVRLWGNTVIDEMMSADTLDGGQVALASGLTVAGWVLLVLSCRGRRRRRVPRAQGCRGFRHPGTCPVLIRAAGLVLYSRLRTRDMSILGRGGRAVSRIRGIGHGTCPFLVAAAGVAPRTRPRARDMSSVRPGRWTSCHYVHPSSPAEGMSSSVRSQGTSVRNSRACSARWEAPAFSK